MQRLLALVAACAPRIAPLTDAPPNAGDAGAIDTALDAGVAPITTFRNPLNAGPDPFVGYHAGAYYLSSTQGDALRMWTAPSLAELAVAPATTIWTDTDPSRDREMWAPSFYRFGGRWYVYYTADDGIDDHHRIYVIESAGDDPLGPYHFKAKLEAPNATGLWAIDPVVLARGASLYLIWSGAGAEGHNLLYIAPLSDPWTISGDRAYLPANGGCAEVREAPALVQHADTTYLVYSTCDTGKPDYQLWMMTLASGDDPLVAASWRQYPSPIFTRDDSDGSWGPGSNGFFTSPDGSEDWIVYHAKNTSQCTYDARTTRAQRIAWQGGVPDFGAPVAAGTTLDQPSGDPGHGSYFIDDDGTSSGAGTVEWSGSWIADASCGVQCFHGGEHRSTEAGATATLRFTGTQIALFATKDADRGSAAISLDGGPPATIDYYLPLRQGEQAVYTSPHVPYGDHELRITLGTSNAVIGVDRAEVFTR